VPPNQFDQTPEQRQFFQALRELHLRAGEPSSRTIATRIGQTSHTTVNLALRGPRVPSWPVVAKVVEALDGDVEAIRPLWIDAQEREEPSAQTDDSDVQVFVSYARIDDEATYGRISKLIVDIANTYQSITGSKVAVFKDTDSIRPGEDWRDRIRAGLSYSTIFLAFITPAYLRSAPCREELNEFLAFLTAGSAERLVLPLIYTKRSRIESDFPNDELWAKIRQRQGPDISNLRYVNPGSSEWITTTEGLADTVDKTLSSFRHINTKQSAKKAVNSIDDTAPPGTLERMASLEEKVPQVVDDMARIGELFNLLSESAVSATPTMASAVTFANRVTAARNFAKQIDPIAGELQATADRLVSNFAEWNFFVQYLLEYAQRGGDLKSPDTATVLASLWTLSKTGSSPLSQVTDFANSLSRGIGISRDLDRPLMAIRSATLRIADMSGILDGWRKALEGLESEYLGEGYLDSLPKP